MICSKETHAPSRGGEEVLIKSFLKPLSPFHPRGEKNGNRDRGIY